MRTLLPLILLAMSAPAVADTGEPGDTGIPSEWGNPGEFSSVPQPLEFRGQHVLLDSSIPIEFPVNLDLFFTEVTITPSLTIAGQSTLNMTMEAESQLTWPESIMHDLQPVPGSGRVSMESGFSFEIGIRVDVDFWSNPINLQLLADEYEFEIVVDDFAPFLLPGQNPNSVEMNSTNGELQFEEGFTLLPINIAGVLGVDIGVVIAGEPVVSAQVSGVKLTTETDLDKFETTGIIETNKLTICDNPGSQFCENPGYLDLVTEYEAEGTVDMGYNVGLDGVVSLDIIDLFEVEVPFDIFEWTIPLFTETSSIEFDSETYRHPLPATNVPITEINFAPTLLGDATDATVTIYNDGELELVGLAVLEGDPAFSLSPEDIVAGPLGQDATIVSFIPTSEGEFSAILTFQTNDPIRPYVNVQMSGEGYLEEDAAGGPILDGSDNDFGLPTSQSLFEICGCASPGLTPSGALPFLTVIPLALRRRRKQS